MLLLFGAYVWFHSEHATVPPCTLPRLERQPLLTVRRVGVPRVTTENPLPCSWRSVYAPLGPCDYCTLL